ncbi:MAG: translation initiation factor IF-2 subunit alpha [Methanomassiliicoccales archaeon]
MQQVQEYPEEGELVVCTVQSVKNFGAFVTLDEYGGKEGLIHIAEISTGWVKYIRDYVKEGQKIVCKVIEVDRNKGHVNLSLKQVNEHQRREKIQQWKNENKARKLLEIVASRKNNNPDEFQAEVGAPLIDHFGSLYAAFEAAASDKNALKRAGFSGSWVQDFISVAKDNIAPSQVKVTGVLEVTSPRAKGVEDVKNALQEGLVKEEDVTVDIQYLGAPRYRVVVIAGDYKRAEEELKKSTERVVKAITKTGGMGKFSREG